MKCKNCDQNYWFGDYALNYCKVDKEIITDESECRFMCLGMANGGKKIFYVEEVEAVLEYFKQCMDTEINQGKKLGFIAQEIGREINTLGSKANNADIQTIVVKMKDELEKIKEQLANIL